MRSTSSGPIATLIMLVPLVIVPLLAIFGIPQFAALSQSTEETDGIHLEDDLAEAESQDDSDDDIFAPIDDHDAEASPSSFLDESSDRGELAHHDAEPGAGNHKHSSSIDWDPPSDALQGWQVDGSNHKKKPRPTSLANMGRDMQAADSDQAQTPPDDSLKPSDSADGRAAPKSQPDTGSDAVWSNDATIDGTMEPAHNDIAGAEAGASEPSDEYDIFERSAAPDYESFAAIGNGSNAAGGGGVPADGVADTSATNQFGKPLTWRAAIQRLNAMGIRQYQLQPGGRDDVFHFSCCFTPVDNPRILHRFEAEAVEPLKAVQMVLQQIEHRFEPDE